MQVRAQRGRGHPEGEVRLLHLLQPCAAGKQDASTDDGVGRSAYKLLGSTAAHDDDTLSILAPPERMSPPEGRLCSQLFAWCSSNVCFASKGVTVNGTARILLLGRPSPGSWPDAKARRSSCRADGCPRRNTPSAANEPAAAVMPCAFWGAAQSAVSTVGAVRLAACRCASMRQDNIAL